MESRTSAEPATTVHAAEPARVGDGFFVHRALPLRGQGLEAMEPFLLLDHAGPTTFGPTLKARGVDVHPHKGFQTVTLAYQGDLVHRDSAGNRGNLSAGDVQWMTAGRGIVHEEKHGPLLTANGGVSEMIQLWINLPKADKIVAPHYTDYRADVFPVIPLSGEGANFVRLISGQWRTYAGPAETYTPLTLADLYLDPGTRVTVDINPSWNTAIYVVDGAATVDGIVTARRFIAQSKAKNKIVVEATTKTHALFMSAEPIGEPIASRGPFVMNTEDELTVAMGEFTRGELGVLR